VWLGRGDGRLIGVAPTSRRDIVSAEGPAPIDVIEFGHGAVWTVDALGGTVTRHDPASLHVVAVIPIAGGVDAIVVGEEGIWALSRSLGSLTRVDVVANEATQIVQVGAAPTAATAGQGAIWVGDEDGVIRRVDEETRQVTEIALGAEIRALAFDESTDTLWVDVA
jgi:streptogramin lyase